MPYGRKAGNVRAYEFGCGQPIAGLGPALHAMRGRVRLWNELVELQERYVVERECIVLPLAEPSLDRLWQAGVAAKSDQVARKARSRAWRAIRRDLFAREDVGFALKALDQTIHQESRRLCRESGLHWCNYEEVLVAWQQARRRPGELQFHSIWREPGKLTMRWQHGLAINKTFGSDTRMQVRPAAEYPDVPGSRWQPSKRGLRPNVWMLNLRAASDECEKPIWLTLPVVLHRPLPPAGMVRQASVLRERVGTKYHWKLVLVIQEDATPVPTELTGRVSVDLGWRKLDGGIRVCAWRDDEGREGEERLPGEWAEQYAKVEDLRSIRDKQFDTARESLVAWKRETLDLPDWLRQETRNLHLWKATARLTALVRRWHGRHFAGDEAIFETMRAWRAREVHLWDFESHRRDRLLRARREQYRRFAARLAGQYGEVVLEHFELDKVARRLTREEREALDVEHRRIDEVSRHSRVMVAPYSLRLAIVNACEREGVTVTYEPAAYTTLTCHACGHVDRYDTAKELVHTCSACGNTLDQDLNAARVLLSQNDGSLPQAELLRV